MRTFVTGGTGYVGGAVLRELHSHGHQVVALVRRATPDLEALPRVETVVGDLARPETYVEAAATSDAIVHCALEYSAAGEEGVETDRVAMQALLEAAGTDGHVVYTSNLFACDLASPDPLDEDAAADLVTGWRRAHERMVLDARATTAVIRLAFVYGGAGGYIWQMLAPDVDGALHYVEGPNRWPFVHVHDLADLYRRVVETREQGLFHGADGTLTRVADAVGIVADLVGATVVPHAGGSEAGQGHVSDLMRKDVAAGVRRSFEIGWRPGRASFSEGAREAYLSRRLGD